MTATLTRAELERMVGGTVTIDPQGNARVTRIVVPPNDATPQVPASPYRNQWEARYAEHLDRLRDAGAVQWWGYETIRLRLTRTRSNGRVQSAWYTPDFAVLTDRVELHEVKGFWREAARLRVKLVAERYPFLLLHVIQYRGGRFVTVEVFHA